MLASLAALVVLAGAVASVALAAAPPAGAANWAPVHAGDFPDPSVMEWLGTYYGFATQNFAAPSQTINIQVSTSSNGVDWSQQSGVDALPTVGSWAKPGNTWAPSVVRDNTDNDFVMYYTATEIQTGDQCIGVATSVLPEGPYTDTSAQPMVCQNGVGYSDPTVDSTSDLGGSIDPDIFTDSSGNQLADLEERRQSPEPSRADHPVVHPARTRLLAHGQRPTDAPPDRRRRLAERDHRGPRHGRDLDDDGQHDDEQLHPLLFRQRRGRVHLCHRLGQLPLRSGRRLHR